MNLNQFLALVILLSLGILMLETATAQIDPINDIEFIQTGKLFTDEKELNKLVPIKKLAPYRTNKDEQEDKTRFNFWKMKFIQEREDGNMDKKSDKVMKKLRITNLAPETKIRMFFFVVVVYLIFINLFILKF